MHTPSRLQSGALVAALALPLLGCGLHSDGLSSPSGQPASSSVPTPAPTPSTTPSPSATAAVLPAAFQDSSAAFNGASGWRITTSSQLQLTSTSGQAWTTVSLPATLPVSDVMAVSTAPGGPTLVAAPTAGGVDVLVQAATGGSWVTHQIVPPWPADSGVSGPPASVIFTQAPGGFVDMALGVGLGHASELVDNLVSTNGGASFVQTMLSGQYYWQGVTFASPSDGIVVAGPAFTFLYDTSDGGATWASASLPAAFAHATFGWPLTSPSGFLVPATLPDGDGGETVTLLASTDGQSFTQAGTPLTIPAASNPGGIIVAADQGNSLWVFAQGHVMFTSTNGGGTWTQVTSPTLPVGIGSASFSTPTMGTVVSSTTSCAAYKSDCTSATETLVTTDGGLTWTAQT